MLARSMTRVSGSSDQLNTVSTDWRPFSFSRKMLGCRSRGATENKSFDQYGNSIGAINAVPPLTLSAGLLYEKGPISADVNWDYAASYQYACSQCTEVPGWPAVSSPFQWLTATFHYKFTREFQVYVEGKNLTDAVARTYLNGNPLLPWAPGQNVGQSSSGVGASYQF
jgi:iron complex outermembrane receptor protein